MQGARDAPLPRTALALNQDGHVGSRHLARPSHEGRKDRSSAGEVLDQRIHGTRNLVTPDPECDLDYVPEGARDVPIEYAVSNSLGFGGHNSSLVFKRFSE